jgi:hypothetical protein
MRSRPTKWWIITALGANLLLAAIIFVARGAGVDDTETALAATARVTFLWFWVAYTGGALTTLFGAAFLPLKQHGREFGIAFAAALLVHLSLVAWLCSIDAPPKIGVFIVFGAAAAFTFLLALFSFGNLHALLGPKWWLLLRTIGMNFILCAFFTDFMKDPLHGGIERVAEYLPFVMMTAAAPLLRLAAWLRTRRGSRMEA